MALKNRSYIIGIAGASGSGKTYLSHKLHQRLGHNNSVIVAVDSYYNLQKVPFEVREKTNYDHPDSLELTLLAQHLHELVAGKEVKVPVYNYAIHNRVDEVTVVAPVDYIIVEGILTFHLPQIRELLNYKIFVNTPLTTCFNRRLERDTRERGRTAESVNNQWNATVLPMYNEFCGPSAKYADVVYNGECVSDDFVESVIKFVSR